MKVEWEAKDIRGGRVVVRSGSSDNQLIIGYRESDRSSSSGPDNRWCLISMDDGLNVYHTKTPLEIAGWLTAHGYLPKELT